MQPSLYTRVCDRLRIPADQPDLAPGSAEHDAILAALDRVGVVGPVNILAFAGLFWWLGQPNSAIACAVTAVVLGWALATARAKRAFAPWIEIAIGGNFAMQLAVHLDLGGYSASAAYAVWGVLNVLIIAVVIRKRRRYLWMFGYIAANALLGLAEPFIRPRYHPLPDWFEAFMYANMAVIIAWMTFTLLDFYIRELETEKARSERLLLNILPAPIADRLKQEQGAIADAVPRASVLFSDIVGFTKLAGRVSPAELVDILNSIFSRFDALADKHGVEKIKTIGDAYMAVAGLPEPNADPAAASAAMALDMRDAMADLRRELDADIRVRIGIHSGPVVAGVIGARKFAYDLWGDTVNTASRMESHGVAGAVQASEATRELLGDRFAFEARGEIEVKGKGPMHTFLVERA